LAGNASQFVSLRHPAAAAHQQRRPRRRNGGEHAGGGRDVGQPKGAIHQCLRITLNSDS
jgi:hypothetical protein